MGRFCAGIVEIKCDTKTAQNRFLLSSSTPILATVSVTQHFIIENRGLAAQA